MPTGRLLVPKNYFRYWHSTAVPAPVRIFPQSGIRRRSRLFGRSRIFEALYPLRAPGACLEGIGEILRFSRTLPGPKLHDADCVRRLTVVAENVLRDPKISGAENAPHLKLLFVRLQSARGLYVAASANALPRLRIFQYGIVVI